MARSGGAICAPNPREPDMSGIPPDHEAEVRREVDLPADAIFLVDTQGRLVWANDGASRVGGLLLLIFGPIVARIYAEILIIFFRINDHLRAIQHNTQRV